MVAPPCGCTLRGEGGLQHEEGQGEINPPSPTDYYKRLENRKFWVTVEGGSITEQCWEICPDQLLNPSWSDIPAPPSPLHRLNDALGAVQLKRKKRERKRRQKTEGLGGGGSGFPAQRCLFLQLQQHRNENIPGQEALDFMSNALVTTALTDGQICAGHSEKLKI